MKIKDFLKKFGIKNNVVDTKDYTVEECNLEVCIDSDLLAVTLGQWMGMLYDSTKSSNNGVTIYTSLEPEEYLNKFGLSYKVRQDIQKRFANILSKAGFPEEDICVLENFNVDENTFGATFFHNENEPKFKIRFGSWLENGPELTVTCNNVVNLYNVWMGDKNTKDRVVLDYSIKTLNNNSKKFAHSVSEYSYRSTLYNKENKINIHIEYPATLDLNLETNPFINEELIEEVLSNVEFPVDIQVLTSEVAKALKNDVNEYPSINISVATVKENKKTTITDEVRFKNGQFVSLKLTKNGKTICIDEFDSWSYVTDGYNITQDKDKNISYGYNSMPIDKFEEMPTPTTLISDANKDVEEVKGIALTLFKK